MEKTLKGEFILGPDESSQPSSTIDIATPKPTAKHHHDSPHFYSAFADHPKNVVFAEQQEGEEIVLLLRRHFITNFPWLIFSLFLIILPIFFPLAAATFPFPQLLPATVALLVAFYYLFIFGFVLLNFALWYFHIGLVTNLRILDIDLAGILYRQITATKHENVEDVTYSQTGFIASLFNYGYVYIQTAGTEVNIEFDKVPRPARAADIISDLSKPV